MRRKRTADLEPTPFGGRYTLLRRLAIGGMAEIYLARQTATSGFEKEVVIKRLRAELADDPRIVEMFLDEAKIGAQLNHPNIVHVYDVDEHDGIPYIAMEYIVGEELNELCRRGIAQGRFLPLEHAVELIRQAAAGMGYFHAKRSSPALGSGTAPPGEPLDIVHLDISPSNLLVTQDGFLKVIDFGIARARGLGTAARGDVLPGKLSYMSPEQAARRAVDHRSDIFSLGIVLYEITVGRRLFRGAAQEVVARLVDAKIEPPTFSRRNFPPALEAIVMRTLEKHPEDRYQSAYDLADDLEAFLRDERLHSGPVRIARYLDMLTSAAGGPRRPELVTEAEGAARGAEELDFDSQVFDGFAPSEGAPGPEQAPLWEDVEQPEADIAAALQMELAELRALRTPVPTRPSGMAPVRGDSPLPPRPPVADPTSTVTRPVRLTTDEWEGEDGELPTTVHDALAEPPTRIERPLGATPVPGPAPLPPAGRPSTIRPLTSPPLDAGVPAPGPAPGPAIGAAFLARSGTGRRPWLLLALVLVAALGAVAYIVLAR